MITIFRALAPITLASTSPRRKEFITALGVEFTTMPCSDTEEAPLPHEQPHEYVQRLAKHKAYAVSLQVPRGAIIAADTDVFLDGAVLGKPNDAEHAFCMLRSLAGKKHIVATGCCVLYTDAAGVCSTEDSFYAQAIVEFAPFPDAVLRAYANSLEPLDKAGSYAIQGQGSFLVQAIHGSWTAVVGLPMAELVHTLLRRNIIAPQEAAC